jgi:outer membrane lipase/esterase
MLKLKNSRCSLALAAAAISGALLLDSGLATAQSVQDDLLRICTPVGGGGGGGGGRPECAGGPPGTMTSDAIASITPNQFNSLNFLGSTNANSELDEATRRLRRKREAESASSRVHGDALYAAANPTVASDASSGERVVGPLSLFVAGRGGILDRDDTATQRGFSGSTGGARIGADYRVTPQLLLGSYLSFDHINADYVGGAGKTDSDNYGAFVYGTYNATDRLYFEAVGGYTYNTYTVTRNGTFTPAGAGAAATTPFTATGNTHGNQWLGTIGLGYENPIGAATITPYARFSVVQTRVNGYTESSTSLLGTQVNGTTTNSITSVAGLRGSYAIGLSWGVLVPQARGEYIHEFDGARQSSSAFSNDPARAPLVISDVVQHDYGRIGVGVTAVLPRGVLPFFDYEALVGDEHASQHIFTAGLRLEL